MPETPHHEPDPELEEMDRTAELEQRMPRRLQARYGIIAGIVVVLAIVIVVVAVSWGGTR